MGKTVIRRSALALALLLLPSLAVAAGLGKLTVFSALGQPLKAEIELLAVDKGEADNLSVRLPPEDVFRKANIEYAGALLSVKFKIEKRGENHYVIDLSSGQPIKEPFLDLLVELDWNTGRLVREYTFLLDPPEYRPPQAAPAIAAPTSGTPTIKSVEMPKQPLQERALGEERKAPAVAVPVAPKAAARTPAPQPKAAPARAAAPKAEQPAAQKTAKTYQVKRGDTLTKIANANRTGRVSLQQMLIALYRSNVDEFDGNNMNRIRAGKILKIPDVETAAAIDQEEATRTIVAQASDFEEYRRKLGAAVAAAPERKETGGQRVSGKITAKVEEKPAAAKVTQDQLKLSRAEAGTKRTAQGLQEDLFAKEKEIKEANERIAMLEKNLQDMQKLLQLKSGSGAQLEQQAAKGAPPKAAATTHAAPQKPAEATKQPVPAKPVEAQKPEEAAKPAPKPAPKPAAAKPARKIAPPPPPPPPEPSLLDEILANELALYGGGGFLLLLFVGYFYYAWRRKKAQQQMESSLMAAPDLAPGAVFGEGAKFETGPSEIPAEFAPGAAAAESEEVDPIAEAEVYMAYGRDMQAEEILKEALAKDPSRQPIRAKLLEIYASRKDAKAFEAVATELQAATGGVGAEWEKALALGSQLDPENPLYGGKAPVHAVPAAATVAAAATVVAATEVQEPAAQAAGGLDFDLGLGDLEAVTEEQAPGETGAEPQVSGGLDFDLGLGEPAQAPAPEAATEAAAIPETSAGLDFDLGLGEPEQAAESQPEPAAETGAAAADLGFDLDLGGGEEKKAEPAQEEEQRGAAPAADSAAAIDFDFELPGAGNESAPAQAEPAAEQTPVLEVPAASEPEKELPAGEGLQAPVAESPELPALETAAESLEVPAEAREEKPAAADSLELPSLEAAAEPAALEIPATDAVEAQPQAVAGQETPAAESLEIPALESAPEPETPGGSAAETAAEPKPEALEIPASEQSPAASVAEADVDFDFNLDLPEQKEEQGGEAPEAPLDLSSISLDLGAPGEAALSTDAQWQEVATKLDLAKAYQEMGDMDGARELLDEVMNEGDAAQKQQAQTMLTALG